MKEWPETPLMASNCCKLSKLWRGNDSLQLRGAQWAGWAAVRSHVLVHEDS